MVVLDPNEATNAAGSPFAISVEHRRLAACLRVTALGARRNEPETNGRRGSVEERIHERA